MPGDEKKGRSKVEGTSAFPALEAGTTAAHTGKRDALRKLAGPEWREHLTQSQRVADQIRSISAVGEQFSAATSLVTEMRKLAAVSDSVAKMARIGWPDNVSEALFQGLRPHSAVSEVLKLVATGGALAHVKQLGLDADKFSEASKHAREMQGVAALAKAARMDLPSFESGIAAELRRLQKSMAVFRPDSQLDRIARDFSASLAPYQSQFQAISKALEAATATLRPSGDMLGRMAEEDRIAQFILDLGFVPHGELWEYIAEIECPEGTDLAEFSEQLIAEIWPELAQRLALEASECMDDAKLHATFGQMLAAHEAELYEMVMNSVPTILERAVSLARGNGEKKRTFEWLKTEVAELPISHAGGYRGYRVWKILIDHTFAGCWTDAEADAIKYPNRHAAAHGIGTRTVGRIDSLNALLLTHFVLTTAKAVRDFKASDAA